MFPFRNEFPLSPPPAVVRADEDLLFVRKKGLYMSVVTTLAPSTMTPSAPTLMVASAPLWR